MKSLVMIVWVILCIYRGSHTYPLDITTQEDEVTSTEITSASDCVDVHSGCRTAPMIYCSDIYIAWALKNCKKHCGLCRFEQGAERTTTPLRWHVSKTTDGFGRTTTPLRWRMSKTTDGFGRTATPLWWRMSSKTDGSPRTTTPSWWHPSIKVTETSRTAITEVTTGTPSASDCVDVYPGCPTIPDFYCFDSYRTWALKNCKKQCGLCSVATASKLPTTLWWRESTLSTAITMTSIRLVNGTSSYEGRVEVYHGGQWGTVCDDSFTKTDAEVVCRLADLRYWSGYAAYYSSAYFGEGTGRITLDDLNCSGYETDISHCSSNGWLRHNCAHSEDVGVDCGTRVRLVGGRHPWEGKLEVMYKGSWGTVCDDSFDYNEARVVCNMLGYGYSYSSYSNSYFPHAGSGQILLDDLRCNGYEDDIAQCMTKNWGVNDCFHNEDIGIYCYGPSSEEQTTTGYWYQTTPYPWWLAVTTAKRDLLEDAIHPSCTSNGWNIEVDLYKLRQIYPTARAEDIYLGENSCSGQISGYYVYFRQGLRDCLTSETVSAASLVYRNQLIYAERDQFHPFIIHHYNWTVDVECDVAKNRSVSSHVSHESATSGPYHHVQSSSHYNVLLSFYRDSNFVDEIYSNPLHAKIGQNIYVKVHTDASDWRVKMRLHTCYTKPTTYAPDHLKYYLIKNGCEVDRNTHIISQSTHETKFVFQDFEYTTNHEGFQIYCDATFCETNDYSSQCEQTCNPRGKRDAQTVAESAYERQTYVTETVTAHIVNY